MRFFCSACQSPQGSSKAGVGFPPSKDQSRALLTLWAHFLRALLGEELLVLSVRGALNTDRQDVTQEDSVDTVFQPSAAGPTRVVFGCSFTHSFTHQMTPESLGDTLSSSVPSRVHALSRRGAQGLRVADTAAPRLNEAAGPDSGGAVTSPRNGVLAVRSSLPPTLHTLLSCSLC